MEIAIINFTPFIYGAAILIILAMVAMLTFGIGGNQRLFYSCASLVVVGVITILVAIGVQTHQLNERGAEFAQYAESTYGAELTTTSGADLLGGYDTSDKAVWTGSSNFVIIDSKPVEVRAFVINGVATLTYFGEGAPTPVELEHIAR